MISTDVALIMTIGGIAGSILVTQMWQMNWFKRENFKYDQSINRKENSIRFKKMEKDLGLKAGSSLKSTTAASPLDWIETIKKLDPNVVHRFIDSISGVTGVESEEEESPGGIEGTIMNIAQNNPELVQNFIAGLNKGQGEQQGQQTIR